LFPPKKQQKKIPLEAEAHPNTSPARQGPIRRKQLQLQPRSLDDYERLGGLEPAAIKPF